MDTIVCGGMSFVLNQRLCFEINAIQEPIDDRVSHAKSGLFDFSAGEELRRS